MSTTETVLVRDHRTTTEPVYHTSAACPKITGPHGHHYVDAPRWVAELAGLRQCRMNGACQS